MFNALLLLLLLRSGASARLRDLAERKGQYGLSTQDLPAWLLDRVKGMALSDLLMPPVVALGYWTIRRSPRAWWAGFWLACIPLIVISTLLAPLVIDPLFNRF